MAVFKDNNYVNQTFTNLTLEKEHHDRLDFENCKFIQCKFVEAVFSHTRFTDCDFTSCDLSLAKFPGCKFSEVSFKNSKLIGINWTELNWPLIKLTSPLYFYSCNLSHSSFYGLELSNLLIEECKAHDIDFRDANLSHASFAESDLLNSLFLHTNLNSANFTNAINYTIDPNENRIKRARFSFPDVLTLLNYFDIIIEGSPFHD